MVSDLTSEPDPRYEWQRFNNRVYQEVKNTVGYKTKGNKRWISEETQVDRTKKKTQNREKPKAGTET